MTALLTVMFVFAFLWAFLAIRLDRKHEKRYRDARSRGAIDCPVCTSNSSATAPRGFVHTVYENHVICDHCAGVGAVWNEPQPTGALR